MNISIAFKKLFLEAFLRTSQNETLYEFLNGALVVLNIIKFVINLYLSSLC